MTRAMLIAGAPLVFAALGTGCADQVAEDLPPGAFTSGPIIDTYDDLGIDDTTGTPDDDGMLDTGGDDDDDDDMMETGMGSSDGEIMCDDIPDGLTHTDDIAPIWAGSCQDNATCHVTGGSLPDLQADAYANLQNNSGQAPALQYIAAGDPENSYLVAKIEGRQEEVGGLGGVMPAGGGVLDPCDAMLIAAWVEQGAAE